MKAKCEERITVPDNVDAIHIRFSVYLFNVFLVSKCQIHIYSRAFAYVDQLYEVDVPRKLLGKNCILFGTSHNADEDPPYKVCKDYVSKKTFTYSQSNDFTVKALYENPLRFNINMNMHARANGGKPFITDVSHRTNSPYTGNRINMKIYCGKVLEVPKESEPFVIDYVQGYFGTANCTVTIHNQNQPFDRIALQVLEYKEINGFCLHTKNIGSVPGLKFCEYNPPDVSRTFPSAASQHDFSITISGNGSAFMSFQLLLYSFHQGECYDKVCGKNICIPEAYTCHAASPCSNICSKDEKKLSEHLSLFCVIFTAVVIVLEFLCYARSSKPKEGDENISMQQRMETRPVLDLEVDHNVEPSAPLPEIVPSPDVEPSAPGLDLPPSYDEVVTHPDKYGGPVL